MVDTNPEEDVQGWIQVLSGLEGKDESHGSGHGLLLSVAWTKKIQEENNTQWMKIINFYYTDLEGYTLPQWGTNINVFNYLNIVFILLS